MFVDFPDMRKGTGIGGGFLRAKDPAALSGWYAPHLDVPIDAEGQSMLRWSEDGDPDAFTVWAAFAGDTDYFGRDEQQVMINYRVADLTALLGELRGDG